MLAGFGHAGYVCTGAPAAYANPVKVEWHVEGRVRAFRLWCFEITHGGGERNADEFRIQITRGPSSGDRFDEDGAVDLLIGYSRDREVVVAYDRRWLENWTSKKETAGSGGSPSVQVQSADIQAGRDEGIHRLTKNAGFGEASVVTMSPAALPAYLLNHGAVLGGTMSAAAAQEATPLPASETIVDYCPRSGIPVRSRSDRPLLGRAARKAVRDPGRCQRHRQIQARGAWLRSTTARRGRLGRARKISLARPGASCSSRPRAHPI